MSSLTQKDRVSLCSFTFSDGRRCRTPRLRDNPRFCPYHAQKEAQARAAQSLGKDLAYFFSGDYLSACDLSTALGRLIPAVIRGDVKPRAARTVAYLAQTLLQAIHLSKHEYINAFGTDGWRQSIHNSVRGNYDYRFPPGQTPANCHSERSEESVSSSNSSPAIHDSPLPHAPQPAQTPPSQPVETPANCHPARNEGSASSSSSSLATHHSPLPHTPLPPTSTEFAQNVLASRNLSRPGRETATGQPPQSEIPTSSGPVPSQTPSPIPTQAAPAPPATPSPASSQAQQSEIPTLSGPASTPPSTPPQPAAQPIPAPPSTPPQAAPAAQPCVSLALPLPVRRRLHRSPA